MRLALFFPDCTDKFAIFDFENVDDGNSNIWWAGNSANQSALRDEIVNVWERTHS